MTRPVRTNLSAAVILALLAVALPGCASPDRATSPYASGGSPTGNTEVVAYDYVNSAVGAGNYSRKTSMDNPSATTLHYHYDGGFGIDDAISRISRIDLDDPFIQVIGADDLVAYDYLGAGGVAVTDYRNDVQLDRTVSHDGKRNAVGHTSQASGTYPAFDRFGRVVRHAWVDGQYGPGTDLTDGLPNRTPILEQTHTFDRASNRTSRVDARPGASIADRDFSFSYDELDRLTSSTRGAWDAQSGQMQTFAPGGQHWDLDVLGNWTERTADSDGDGQFTASDDGETRLHNVVNELTQRAIDADGFNRDLTYDDNGNLREEQIGSQADRVYTHDAWNRLVEVGIDGGSGVTPIARYEYNGLDWRTVREHDTAGGSLQIDERRTLFYSASWRLLEEQVEPIPPEGSEPNEIMQHLWGLRYQDDLVANHRLGGQVEQGGMTIIEASETFYAITDLQFSVVGMMDAGLVRERVSYDAYGNATHRWMADVNGDGFATTADEQAVSAAIGTSIGDGGFAAEYDVDRSGTIDSTDLNYVSSQSTSIVPAGEISSDAMGNTIGYSGYRFNQETQHYHVRNRCYSPELGRWLERDPIGYVDGMSLYQYVGSSPSQFNDPYGLDSYWLNPRVWREFWEELGEGVESGGLGWKYGGAYWDGSGMVPAGYGGAKLGSLSGFLDTNGDAFGMAGSSAFGGVFGVGVSSSGNPVIMIGPVWLELNGEQVVEGLSMAVESAVYAGQKVGQGTKAAASWVDDKVFNGTWKKLSNMLHPDNCNTSSAGVDASDPPDASRDDGIYRIVDRFNY